MARYALSPRQQQVAALYAQGLKREEVAARLFLSLGRVKNHLQDIYQVAGVRNQREFMRWWLDQVSKQP